MDARDLFVKVFKNQENEIKSVERVPGGYSNLVFKLTNTLNRKYKVRIGDNNDLINRVNEYAILKALGSKDYYYYDIRNGNSIWKWVEGECIKPQDINQEYLDKLVEVLQKVHSSPVNTDILVHDDLEFFEKTKKLLVAWDADKYYKLVQKYKDLPRVLCHNDVSLGNLIFNANTGKLTLIDYEWGRVNTPYWEYGNFIKESDISMDNIQYLAKKANLNSQMLVDYVFIATVYSLQLSYMFPHSIALDQYRLRLNNLLNKYRSFVS